MLKATTARGLVLLAVALATSCRRAPKCDGELDRDELMQLQKLTAEGKYPCTEHLEPRIEVDRTGVTLSGRRVAGADELPSGRLGRIKGLSDALKSNRETWKQVHPGEAFDAHPNVRIDGGLDFAVGASALMTTAYAGYANATVSVGNVSFEMSYALPRPPSPDSESTPNTELVVRRLEPHGYSADLRDGKIIKVASPDLGFEAVPGWVARECAVAPDPCARVLALDLRGEFIAAATLIRSITDGPGFRTRPPLLRFVLPPS